MGAGASSAQVKKGLVNRYDNRAHTDLHSEIKYENKHVADNIVFCGCSTAN